MQYVNSFKLNFKRIKRNNVRPRLCNREKKVLNSHPEI